MKPLIVRYSRWYFILLPLAFLAFASSPFAILHEVKQLKRWDLFGLIAFSAAALLAGWSSILVFRRKPLLILDDKGLFAEELAVGIISWLDIEQAFLHERGMRKNRVELLLRNPDVYLKQRSGIRRALGDSEFVLSLKGADTSPEKLVAHISQRLNQQSSFNN
ncbi:MAG: hypothetical protein EOO58_03550 [Hymenobacter sp.]|nr:MAG: hypothetical protein EOO58_03550 [Hymenobacter sp.]